MSRPAVAVALWLAFLGALAVLGAAWSLPWLPLVLFGGALLAPALALAGLAVDRDREPDREAVPDVSAAVPLSAVGVSALVVGAEAGLWLILIGAGLLTAGVALAARELSQSRRAGR
jgi:hypothetical protein